MLNREMMPAGAARKAEVSEPQRFRFITSRSGNEVNFFRFGKSTLPDSKYFKVYINGTETVQNYKAISFAKGDEITIQLIDDTQYYPYIKTFEGLATPINYFREILEPLPQMFIKSGQAVTDFTNCFSQCSNLTTIPAGLFDNNTAVTDFSSCFNGCSNLTTIPAGLFDNNTAVTDFGLCFYNCTNLTAIPAGLFDNNTAVTTFDGCFSLCSNLTTIPAGLFDNNTAVTDFSYCFYDCSNLTTIPAGLFDNNTAVTTFSNCFSLCSNLTTIPAGLFDNNTAVTTFSNCFSSCSNLTTIPAGLFDNNTAVTTFAGCFYYIVKLKNFTLIIGSQKVSYCGRFIYGNSNGTVRVPAGSTTETTFRNANISGLTIEAY